MSPRPPRAWLGEARPVDPAELVGPRGLVPEVLQGEEPEPPAAAPAQAEADAFHRSLLTEARRARIESVVAARLASVTVVLDRLLDPHNVAAILRTAEGLGLLRAHVVPGEGGDGFAHRRVTQDADKWIEVTRHPSGAAAARALQAQGFRVLAGHLTQGAVLLGEVPVDRPLALLFGHEHEGVGAETLAACDGAFRIPMAGFTQSFNVSVAAAMSLYQATSARRALLGRPGDLDEAGAAALRSRFWRLGAKLARRVSGPPRKKE